MQDSAIFVRKSMPMKTVLQIFVLLVLVLTSCNRGPDNASLEQWKHEVRDVERDFALMAETRGIAEAFIHYAAEDAVVMRNDRLIMGRQKLEEYFGQSTTQIPDEKLSWKPDFVDVSASGDLAYTYGQYTYSYTDSTGNPVEHRGVFHTVWKRQSDGSWRFVWD